jgi:hypothetical protein
MITVRKGVNGNLISKIKKMPPKNENKNKSNR